MDDVTPPSERLASFAAKFFEGAGPTMTTMMNRPMVVGVLGIDDVTPVELLRQVPLPWVLVEIRYARGLTGAHWLILGQAGALLLGHALAGDEGAEALEFLPSHEEAIGETVNQILGAASSAIAPMLGRSLGFEPVKLHMVDDATTLPPELTAQLERLWLVGAEATGPDGLRVAFKLTIGTDLAREIVTLSVSNLASQAGDTTGETDGPSGTNGQPSSLGLILDVTLPVSVELGRARMQIQDILKLVPGSIVELDKSAGDPVDILINDRPIARGEVVVIDENFGVRLTSIVTATERIKAIR